MKKNLYCIPAVFFAIACLLNWAGRIWEPALASAVKPALLPLLAASVKMIPLKRGGTVEDIANTALYLASDLSAYVSGQVIAVNGGMYC